MYYCMVEMEVIYCRFDAKRAELRLSPRKMELLALVIAESEQLSALARTYEAPVGADTDSIMYVSCRVLQMRLKSIAYGVHQQSIGIIKPSRLR
jgi:hypothetical protein